MDGTETQGRTDPRAVPAMDIKLFNSLFYSRKDEDKKDSDLLARAQTNSNLLLLQPSNHD